jgi:hypothetical protein
MKKIRLTEADLERVVQRVIDEALGDQLRSRLAGLSSYVATKRHNAQVSRGDVTGPLYLRFERNLASISKRAQLEQNNLKRLQENVNSLINEDEVKTFQSKVSTSDPNISPKLTNFITVMTSYKKAIEDLISINNEIASLYQAPAQPVAQKTPATPTEPTPPTQ